jgi:predicted permease
MMGTWLRRLAYLLQQSRHDAELREEIEVHRSLRAAALERDGLTSREAATASRRAIGSVLLAREDVRQVWLGSWGEWWQDIRYGLRTLRNSPTFTTVAVATLALGIGLNAAIFTVINAVLFRELSVPGAHELVSLSQVVQGAAGFGGEDTFTTTDYMALRDRSRALSGVVALSNVRGEATLGGDVPRKILGSLVSCNFFAVLQQPPALGRALAPHDCDPAAELVIVISHELWRTAFAADPRVVGRTVLLNRQRVTVAGVAAEGTYNGFSFLRGGYLAPLNAGRRLSPGDERYEDDTRPWLTVIGRRSDGANLDQVRAELDVIAAQIDRQQPGRATALTAERARPALPRQLRGPAAGAAVVLMAAFGFVLLIACANVANLLLARGTSRSQEIGIRLSLGASRARVVRQMVTESLLLALAGGLIGSTLAIWSFQALVALALPALLPPWFPLALTIDVRPDLQVIAFAAALTIGTGILFGLVPALHLARPDLHAVMKLDSSGAGRSRRSGRLRGTLVGVQVALCMVLMLAAGLLLRGLYATYTIDPGFEYRRVAFVSLESAFDGYSTEESEARRRRLMADLEALPGVDAVASTDQEPLGDDMAPAVFRIPGDSEGQPRMGEVVIASQGYFSVIGLPILRGRTFTSEEVREQRPGQRPAILSATTARNLWPGSDPIGRTLLWEVPGIEAVQTLRVVGVAADAQVTALGQIDPYYVYVPGEGSAVLVRGRTDIAATVSGIRASLRAADPTLAVPVLPLEATLDWSRGIAGTVTALFGALGALALLLASVGIYGVVSYAVTGRYREIGVRLALGATASSVLALVLRQTMRPVAIGSVIGVVAASALSQILSSVLFGVSPADPVGLGGAALLVVGVALGAGVLAARPAVNADPTATLRYE